MMILWPSSGTKKLLIKKQICVSTEFFPEQAGFMSTRGA
jgi:hypothetical protein